MMSDIQNALSLRFWSTVKKTSDCWWWEGSRRGKSGSLAHAYGGIRVGGQSRLAHRVSWELTNGTIPDALCVLHRCDNTLCVKPDHLFLGTVKDNSDDMIRKGRQVVLRGENNGRAKLTEDAVRTIRRLFQHGNLTQRMIAARFCMSTAVIHRIVRGISWRHLPLTG